MSSVCASKGNPGAPCEQYKRECKERAECCTPAPRHGARTREDDGAPTAREVTIQPPEVINQQLRLQGEKWKWRVSVSGACRQSEEAPCRDLSHTGDASARLACGWPAVVPRAR